MVKCCAPLCGNASYKKLPDVTFHRFPKDVHLKNAWLEKIGRKNWKPKPSVVVCSYHFKAHLLDHSGFRSVLAPGAVPTIFDLPFQEEHELPRPARGETIKQESQNLQPSTSDATPYCHELPRPARGETIKQESQNLQPSTSDATPYCNILTPSTKDLVKTSASGDHMLQELQNLQPHISDATRTYHELPRPARGETIKQESQNLQPSTSDATPYCIPETIDPQNRTQYCCSSARDLSRLKGKIISKDKTLKALREKIRRFKKKVAKFSDIITELKRKLQDGES